MLAASAAPQPPAKRPQIMGILNLTPDSFSDGGSWQEPSVAAQHALQMARDGADVIDVGGESTRPGAQRIPAAEQLHRILPVLKLLQPALATEHPHVRISIDTTLAQVAQAALDAGASMINDVSAGLEDPRMLPLAAERAVPVVLMHMQGQPATMQQNPQYQDVLLEVRGFLLKRADAAMRQGVRREDILIDPGIGFGKTLEHNLHLMRGLRELAATGFAVLLGASRKRFLGAACYAGAASPPVPAELEGATCAATAWGVMQGVSMFRVHDVKANRQAADLTHHLQQESACGA